VFLGLYEGWQMRGRQKDALFNYELEVERLERDAERMHVKGIRHLTGLDPRRGKYWNDERRRQISKLSCSIENWSSPLAVLWIFFCLLVASPLLIIGYFVSGSIRPFIENIWAPVRDPVLAALARVSHRH